MTHQLVIGDIHGCHEELLDLIDRAALAAGDDVIALGDIVDRGPATPAVAAFFQNNPCARVLMGNHERKHVRASRGEVEPALSQRISRRQIGEARYPSVCTWMATLPAFLQLGDALLVHGMFEPGVPVGVQRESVLVGTLAGDRYLRARLARPWYEHYDGECPIVVGHQNIRGDAQPYVRADERVFGLDTGCCTGGALTGLLLPDFKLLSVPSRANHWSAVKALHRDLGPSTQAVETLRFERIERLATRNGLDEARPGLRATGDASRVLRAAEEAIAAIRVHVLAAHETLIARIEDEHRFSQANPRRQSQIYSRAITNPELAPLLHQARQGRLTTASIKRHLKTPGAALRLAQVLMPRSPAA